MFSRVTTALAIVLTASGGAHATGAIDCTDPDRMVRVRIAADN